MLGPKQSPHEDIFEKVLQSLSHVTICLSFQVFKFSNEGDKMPSLTLGKSFTPGMAGCFCQPSSVAVERSGIIYVADG